jgi:cell shape-determining protein MreC
MNSELIERARGYVVFINGEPINLGDYIHGLEVGVPKDYVDDLVKKLDDSRALVKELQAKVDRQRKDNDMKSGQIRQLREEKAKLLADLRKAQAQGAQNERTTPGTR